MTKQQKTSQLPGAESPEDRTVQAKHLREELADAHPSVEEQSLEKAQRERSTGIQGNDVLLRLWNEGKIQQYPCLPADGDGDLMEKFDMALKEFVVPRDNHLPLQFQGYLVGWNNVDLSSTRGTQVCIFATRKGKIITSVKQWQRERERERHAAAVHETPQDALDWLIMDGGNQLGRASREAWELACKVWQPLEGRDVEVVE